MCVQTGRLLARRVELIHGDCARVEGGPRVGLGRQLFAPTLALLALASTALAGVSLSREEATRIGRKIWRNESGGTIAGLTAVERR